MNDNEILAVARKCGYDSGETVEMNDIGIIAFARKIAAMQREKDAQIVESGVLGHGECAAAIRSKE